MTSRAPRAAAARCPTTNCTPISGRCGKTIVAPLIEEARTHTTPSIERSVLLRMGFSSIEAKALVARMHERRLARARRRPPGAGTGAGVTGAPSATRAPRSSTDDTGTSWHDEIVARTRSSTCARSSPTSTTIARGAEAGPGGRRSPHHRLGPFVLEDTSEDLAHSVPLPSAHAFGNIDPQCDCRDHHRDRLRAFRGRSAPHAHGGLAWRRSHHGHPHHGAVAYRRPDRRDAGRRRRHSDHAQADSRHAQGTRRHRRRGRPADQLPLVRQRRGRAGDRRAVRRGRRQRRAPGPAVQRALSRHQHAPLLRRRRRGEDDHGRRRHPAARRRAQRQRHRQSRRGR